jgi:hypothetical protein
MRATATATLLLLIGSISAGAHADGADPAASTAASPAWRATVLDFAKSHFRHPAWGYSHSTRDYALARELAAADHVTLDDDVLFAAAYLHDMAAFAPWAKDNDHADEAARIVDTVLQGTGFPMAKIDAVRGAIRTHMYDRDPVGSEALYLHDADALDWLGAIGVARIFGTVDPNGGDPDGPAAAKMLEENLAQVPPRVLSPAGRARVAPLANELKLYLENLRRESDDLRAL